MKSATLASGGRYPVLRSVAILYVIGAVVIVLAGIAGACWALMAAPDTLTHRTALAAVILAGTFFMVLGLLVIVEAIKLFIDIEDNTRQAAQASRSMSATDRKAKWLEGEETAEASLIRGH